jgi:glycosyltransferase involved in cell wall biosynthesis
MSASPPHPLDLCVFTQQIGSVLSGIGLHARNLVGRLCADGHRVTVVAPMDQRPQGELDYTFVGVPPAWPARNQARWFALSLSFARAWSRLQGRASFDLAHFTDAREALFCRSGVPLVGNVNDTYSADVRSLGYYRCHYHDWASRWGYYHFVHLCEAAGLPRLQAVLANSRFTADVVKAEYRLNPDRVYTVYKSIDAERYRPALALRLRQAPHPPRLLFVGGNMQRKGLPVLIRAAPLVLAVLPQAEFWVVGQDPAQARMEALCRAHGVAERFHFWGLSSQGELIDYYAQSDVFVLPSLTEAFGVVFLEAMAAGLPVVGTRAGGIPEVVEDGVNGLLAQPDDPPSLAMALLSLLSDQTLRSRLSQAGLATAHEFSLSRMMAETYQVYARLLPQNA